MKSARLGLGTSEGRSVFFFARLLFHAPQKTNIKPGAQKWAPGVGRFLPAVAIQDFSPIFFLLFLLFIFLFFRKNRISLVHIFYESSGACVFRTTDDSFLLGNAPIK
jgi:hypothetical protein